MSEWKKLLNPYQSMTSFASIYTTCRDIFNLVPGIGNMEMKLLDCVRKKNTYSISTVQGFSGYGA